MEYSTLLKYFYCKATPQEEFEINAWLENDPDGKHHKEFLDARIMFEGIVMYADRAAQYDSLKNRKNVETNALSSVSSQAKTPINSSKKRSGIRRYAYAAVQFMAVLLLVFGVNYFTRHQVTEQFASLTRKVSVPKGERIQITMDDGTSMWLNAGTEVEFPVFFSKKERSVKVKKGEVLFDVTRDEKRPFYVDTYAGRISVLGTKFNVEAYPEHHTFSTALIKGSIRFTQALTNKDIELKPYDIVKVADDRIYVERLKDVRNIECWTDGLLDITNYPFEELINKMEHAYNVQIKVERETMPVIRYTRGKLRVSDGIVHAMSVLSNGSDFKYEWDSESNTVIIK